MHRVALLVAAYEHIARTRMAGLPLLNAALRTEAVGFQLQLDDEGEDGVLGVLVTPWFMNLLWLPLADGGPLALGATRERTLGGMALAFVGSEAAGCRFEACSLFSPMAEFADPAAVRAVAQAVLAQLRRPVVDSETRLPAKHSAKPDAPRPVRPEVSKDERPAPWCGHPSLSDSAFDTSVRTGQRGSGFEGTAPASRIRPSIPQDERVLLQAAKNAKDAEPVERATARTELVQSPTRRGLLFGRRGTEAR